ncbi:hypothetical protein [Antrihabitans spumae]|uniref:hypothetical protein n=1 Tax=Antrihabitans spumae TaxID=3373370 RepID=UPI00375207CC
MNQRPPWLVPNWWAEDVDSTITGRQFFVKIHDKIGRPRPKKELVEVEMPGWAGMLAAREWVRQRYGPTAARLAWQRREESRDADAWFEVSRLVVDFVDPLSRFTVQFIAAAHDARPDSLPSDAYELVRGAERRVPTYVRSVMAGPARDEAIGGVIDSEDRVDAFLADFDSRRDTYLPVAIRGFGWCLLDKLLHLDDPEVERSLRKCIDNITARYGDIENPPRPLTEDEVAFVHATLLAEFDADPALRQLDTGEAYERAAKTLGNRLILGQRVTRTRIVRAHLKWIEKDEARREAKSAIPKEFVPEPPRSDRSTLDNKLARAHAQLMTFPEYHDDRVSWERHLALKILDNPLVMHAADTIDELVDQAWHSIDDPPPTHAVSADTASAGTLVKAFLVIAADEANPGRPSTGNATDDYAKRLQATRKLLDDHRKMINSGEDLDR